MGETPEFVVSLGMVNARARDRLASILALATMPVTTTRGETPEYVAAWKELFADELAVRAARIRRAITDLASHPEAAP